MTVIRFMRQATDGGGGTDNPPLSTVMGGGHQLSEGVEADGITLKPGYERDAISGEVKKSGSYKEPNAGLFPPKPDPPKPDPPKPDPPKPGTEEGVNPDGTLKEGYKRDANDKVIKDPDYKDPNQKPDPEVITADQALNADGSLKEGFIKNADGTYAIDPNYEEEDESGEKFFGAVEAITGLKYEITYPEGVHPTSPEGIAHRENVIREESAKTFDQYLRKKDPRGYAYLLHREAGGSDADFFGDNKGFQLPELAELKASADMQAAIYKQDLVDKGLTPEVAQLAVDAAVKDSTLAAKAEASWTARDKAQKEQLAALQDQQKKAEEQFNENLGKITNSIIEAIKGDIGFVVPEAEQPAFKQYVLDNLRYADGKFFVVQELGNTNLKTTVETLFFQYKKGDLRTLVTKQAATKTSQALRLRLKDNNKGPGSGAPASKDQTDNLPLSAIIPN